MLTSLKYIVRILLPLITHPEQMWQYLDKARGAETKPDEMQKNYFIPLLGWMSLIAFLCAAFRSPDSAITFDYQYGMKKMLPLLIAYFLGPLLAVVVVNMALKKWLMVEKTPDKERVQLYVFYSTSFLMALEILVAFIPSFRFVSFIFIYLVYITFSGTSTYIRVSHNRRWMTGFVSFVAIWGCPNMIILLMQKMQG